jgi:hypothetical protein
VIETIQYYAWGVIVFTVVLAVAATLARLLRLEDSPPSVVQCAACGERWQPVPSSAEPGLSLCALCVLTAIGDGPRPWPGSTVYHGRLMLELVEACEALRAIHTEWASEAEIAAALDQAENAVDRARLALGGKVVRR